MSKSKNTRQGIGTILLTLCGRCVQQFRNTGEHIVRRADFKQKTMDTCSYCGLRRGWDYLVKNRRDIDK